MKAEDIKIPTQEEVELIKAQKAEILDIPWWVKPQWNYREECFHLDHVEVQRIYRNGTPTRWKLCTSCFTGSSMAGDGNGLRRLTAEDFDRLQEYNRCRSFVDANATLAAEAKAAEAKAAVEQGAKDYSSYLLSDEWKQKRHLVLSRCGEVCEGCGNREATEVHHITYSHIYDEFLFQLLGLCAACHKRWHQTIEQPGKPN